MPLSSELDRTLRAAGDSSDGEDYYQVTDRSSSASVIETGAGGDIVSSEDDEDGNNNNDDARMSMVSFGALAKAQHVLGKEQSTDRKRKRGQDTSNSQDDKLEALRERLRQIKAEKMENGPKPAKRVECTKSKGIANLDNDDDDEQEEEEEEDHTEEGSNSSDSDTAPKARSSKHAPAVQSSKRMVSRKRTVVDVKKPVFRDPRFDITGGAKPDDNVFDKRYSFLKDYRASEIAQLRTAVKKTRNEAEKEKLKKKLLSMESQQKAREAKEKQQEIVHEHKKREKELVKLGKQPYFLKKSEQKKLALIDRFQNMKAKQRDKVIARRRKKVTSKERRNMPAGRRGV